MLLSIGLNVALYEVSMNVVAWLLEIRLLILSIVAVKYISQSVYSQFVGRLLKHKVESVVKALDDWLLI